MPHSSSDPSPDGTSLSSLSLSLPLPPSPSSPPPFFPSRYCHFATPSSISSSSSSESLSVYVDTAPRLELRRLSSGGTSGDALRAFAFFFFDAPVAAAFFLGLSALFSLDASVLARLEGSALSSAGLRFCKQLVTRNHKWPNSPNTAVNQRGK